MYLLLFSVGVLLFAIGALVVALLLLRSSRQQLRESGGLPTQEQIDIDTKISKRQLDLMGVVMHARVSGGTTDDMVAKARVIRDEIQELKQQRDQVQSN